MTYGTLISTVTVGAGGATSIDFNGISNSFTDLLIVLSGRLNSTSQDLKIAFNGTAANSTTKYLDGNGSTTGSASGSSGYVGKVDPSSATASTFSNGQIYIPNYAGSTNKTYSVDSNYENNASTGVNQILVGLWGNTAAITSISITDYNSTGNFVQYSTASLYGIK